MAPNSKRPRIILRPGLDRDVYQILKKLEDANDGKPFKTITAVYDAIKRSNSSLSRQKKRPLEDSIDRVLQVRKEELAESDSEAEIDQPEPPKPDDDRFLLNRQMIKNWNQEPAGQQPAPSSTAEGRAAKKRRLQGEGEERAAESEVATPAPALTPAQSTGLGETEPEKPERTLKKTQKASRHKVENTSNAVRLGGLSEVYNDLVEQTEYILKWPELYLQNGWDNVPGILLSGPSGTGKKSLIQSLASNLEVPLISLTGCFEDPERMERSLNDAIEDAMKIAPCIVYIEHLDWFMPKPGSSSQGEHGRRVVSNFVRQMRRLEQEQPSDRHVLAMATTSRITDVDPAVLKLGLFERTVQVRIPDRDARLDIIKLATEGRALSEDVDLVELSKMTHGFVGADIITLRRIVENIAARRTRHTLSTANELQETETDGDAMDLTLEKGPSLYPEPPSVPLTMGDFKLAIKDFTPSLRKEGFTLIPSVTWDQVGALRDVRDQLDMSIIGPIRDPDLYTRIGINRPAGCILWGPPGCGKTLVAQAVANEAQASFILINGPELLNKYVGESERAVRELFNRARSSTPCILFFDEIDSIVPRRDGGSTEASTRVVNALLAELDGAQDRSGIYVIGTTNRPDMIDQAMLRPGRLSVRLFVDLPTADERTDILRAIYRSSHADCKDEELARLESVALDKRCTDFSGADLGGLHIKAAESAIRRWRRKEKQELDIDQEDWEQALAKSQRSVMNPESYRKLNEKLGKSN